MAIQGIDFKAVREEYACYAQKGKEAYRKERKYVLYQCKWTRRNKGCASRYYQHALAGLRQLGI